VKICYGGGQAAAVLDMTTMRVVMYNTSAEESAEVQGLHDRFGGRQYYRSWTGLSGAGSFRPDPRLRPVSVLRTDVVRPAVPSATETFPGLRLVVLTKHLQRVDDAPLIAVRDSEVFFLDEWELQSFLAGETLESRLGEWEVELTSWRSWGSNALTERSFSVKVHGYSRWISLGKLSLRRVLELLFWEQLYDRSAYGGVTPWESGLGLVHGVDGKPYHAAGGILRRPAELTREYLTRECPWALFVGDPADATDLAYVREEQLEGKKGFWLYTPTTTRRHRGAGYYVADPLRLTSAEAVGVLSSGVLTPELRARLQEHLAPVEVPVVKEEAPLQESTPADPPLADWERELLGSGGE